MQKEIEYVLHIQKEKETELHEGINLVVRWQMTKRGITKKGFFTFVGLKLLNSKLKLTQQ